MNEPSSRILIVAPFKRGQDHGGSHRATAMAERLEERGGEITWHLVQRRNTSLARKAAVSLRGKAVLVDMHPVTEPLPAGPFDAAVAAHSYLAPQLDPLPASVVRIIDFHNLEWRHLDDVRKFETGLRALYLRGQVGRMMRFEAKAISAANISCFTSEHEAAWARSQAPSSRIVEVPSLLPRAPSAEAESLAERDRRLDARFIYIGTLRFPPNALALLRFLESCWPEIKRRIPEASLTVAGDCDARTRNRINSHSDVESLGFVADLGALIEQSAAVLMPIDGEAGTSLRMIYYALAECWVIASTAASRGLSWKPTATASTPIEWADAMLQAMREVPSGDNRIPAARQAALRLQHDPTPWDTLWSAMREESRA